jgi:hypothetical protein
VTGGIAPAITALPRFESADHGKEKIDGTNNGETLRYAILTDNYEY